MTKSEIQSDPLNLTTKKAARSKRYAVSISLSSYSLVKDLTEPSQAI